MIEVGGIILGFIIMLVGFRITKRQEQERRIAMREIEMKRMSHYEH